MRRDQSVRCARLAVLGCLIAPLVAGDRGAAADPATFAPAASSFAANRVAAAELRAVSVDTIGVIVAGSGSLGPDPWRGSRRQVVDALLVRAPLATASPTLNDLFRRLLLAPAPPPEGDGVPGSLLARRAALLLAKGHFEDVRELLAAVSARSAVPALAPVEADLHFLSGDSAGACGVVAGQVARIPDSDLQKALIVCQTLAGRPEAAALGLSLLAETGNGDPGFAALVAALGGGVSTAPAPVRLTPLTWAMADAAEIPVPAAAVDANPPGILRAIATSPRSTAEVRLAAAERAHAAGAISAETLREIYHRVEFPEHALIEPLAASGQADVAKRPALLYLSSLVQWSPNDQLRVVVAALRAAREAGRYPATAGVYAEILSNMPLTSDLMSLAAEAVRALVVAGAEEAAGVWRALVDQESETNSAARAARTALAPLDLAAAADSSPVIAGERLAEWWASEAEVADAAARGMLISGVLEALDVEIPPGLPRPTDIDTAAAGERVRLEESAAAGRLGEVVLRAMLLLGDSAPTATDPGTLAAVVRGLRKVGLRAEARALAVEAVAAAGR
jgi:hypothetical protein